MSLAPVVTIDGPSGVGKGTVSRWLARRLGWPVLDSGALYRLAAIAVVDAGLDADQPEAVVAACHRLSPEFAEQDGQPRVLLNGLDVSTRLREESIAAMASRISAIPQVRAALLERQRDCRQPPGLVADGRDMGTVVFPDAAFKFFLDASVEERARRRWLQLSESGEKAKLDDLLKSVRARDERDRNRSVAPLKPADDAVVLDTTALSVGEVNQRIEKLLRTRGLKFPD